MSDLFIAELFSNPVAGRNSVIDAVECYSEPPPRSGSSFFIHLSELCPVACKHCMYSSTLSPKSLKDSLNKDDLAAAIDLITESRSSKLNITGGGEPFLKFANILRLVSSANVPVIEVVTAGYWAKTVERALSVFDQLNEARLANRNLQELRLRLSLDRYHVEAPRPVTLNHYANVARAWERTGHDIRLGFRSIEPDKGVIDKRLAEVLDARVIPVNNWNHLIEIGPEIAIPVTFNVMRFSGSAADLEERDDLSQVSRTIREYYEPFESEPGKLRLATAVNDAIRGEYIADVGAAVTLDSDGSYWVFAGTSPDRRLKLGQKNFNQSMDYFFADPLTRFLNEDGVWHLSEAIKVLDPVAYHAALLKNDMAFFVEDLLANSHTRLAATIFCTAIFHQRGALKLRSTNSDWMRCEPNVLLQDLHQYVDRRSNIPC